MSPILLSYTGEYSLFFFSFPFFPLEFANYCLRDMKSHNILLDDKWNARISDFGITKMKETHSSGESSKQQPQSMGTIFWTAPEVLDGLPHTEKSDCMLAFMPCFEIMLTSLQATHLALCCGKSSTEWTHTTAKTPWP
jgi:serine/threonine protein kinase